MALSIVTQPALVALTGNDILFELESNISLTQNTNLILHIEILYLTDAGNWETAEKASKAAVNGSALFYIQTYLDSQNEVPYNLPGTDIGYVHQKAITNYKIKYYETYTSVSTGTAQTGSETESSVFYALQGGISRMDEIYLKSLGYTNWWSFYQASKGFLTHRAASEQINTDQTIKLWLVNLPGNATITAKAEITTETGSTSTKTIKNGLEVSATVPELVELDVSPKTIFTEAEQLTLASYKIILDTTLGNDYYSEKEYQVHTKYFERNCHFIMQNSYGCWDGVWARGWRSEKSLLETESYAQRVRFADAVDVAEVQNKRAILEKHYLADFGFLPPAELPTMEDFFISPKIRYIHKAGSYVYAIPIKILTTEIPGLADGVNLVSQPFDFELSFQDKFYSSFRI